MANKTCCFRHKSYRNDTWQLVDLGEGAKGPVSHPPLPPPSFLAALAFSTHFNKLTP